MRGRPRGGLEGVWGLFGPPVWPRNLTIRPQGYFFKLRSILMLRGLKTPIKSEKITKNQIHRRPGFQTMMKYWFELTSPYSFPRRIRISSPNRPKIDPGADFDQFSKNLNFLKISKNRWAAASAGGFLNREWHIS